MPPNISIKNAKWGSKSLYYQKQEAVLKLTLYSGIGIAVLVRDLPPNTTAEVCLVDEYGLVLRTHSSGVVSFPSKMKSDLDDFHSGRTFTSVIYTAEERCRPQCLTQFMVSSGSGEQQLHTYLQERGSLVLGPDGVPLSPPDRIYCSGKQGHGVNFVSPASVMAPKTVFPVRSPLVFFPSSEPPFRPPFEALPSTQLHPVVMKPASSGRSTIQADIDRRVEQLRTHISDGSVRVGRSMSSSMIHSASFCASSSSSSLLSSSPLSAPSTPLKRQAMTPQSCTSFSSSTGSSGRSSKSKCGGGGGGGFILVTPYTASFSSTTSSSCNSSSGGALSAAVSSIPLFGDILTAPLPLSSSSAAQHQRAFLSPSTAMFSPIRALNSDSRNASHSTTPLPMRSPAPKRCLDADLSESSRRGLLLWDTLVEDLPYAACCESDDEEEEEKERSVRCEPNNNFNNSNNNYNMMMMSPVEWRAPPNNTISCSQSHSDGRRPQPLSAVKTRGTVSFTDINTSSSSSFSSSLTPLSSPPPFASLTSCRATPQRHVSEPPSFFEACEAQYASSQRASAVSGAACVSTPSTFERHREDDSQSQSRYSSGARHRPSSSSRTSSLRLLEDDLLREGDSEGESNSELAFLLAGDEDGDVTFSGFGVKRNGDAAGGATRAACVSACTVPVTTDGEEEEVSMQLLTHVLDVPTPVRSMSRPFASDIRPFSPVNAQQVGVGGIRGSSRSTPLFGGDAASPFKKRKQKR